MLTWEFPFAAKSCIRVHTIHILFVSFFLYYTFKRNVYPLLTFANFSTYGAQTIEKIASALWRQSYPVELFKINQFITLLQAIDS